MKRMIIFVCLLCSLMWANRWTSYLFSNDYTTVRQGIRLGGDLNARWRGMTPLYNACRSGWSDIVELMISRGADLNAASYGETPLLKVVGKKVNDITLAKILIGNGAKINAQDAQGNTPLYHAIINKNKEMIKLLLNNGADMYIQNKRGDSPARFILSKKQMPSISFENSDLMLGAQAFALGRSMVTINVANKTNQFLKISQLAVYFNKELVGTLAVNVNVPPRSKSSNVGTVKLPGKMYKTFKINDDGQSQVKYGLAIEYSLDGASKSFEETKDVDLTLW